MASLKNTNKRLLKMGGGLDFEPYPLAALHGKELSMDKVLGFDPGEAPTSDIDLSNLIKYGIFQDGSNVCVAVDMFEQLYLRSRYLRIGQASIRPCEVSILGHYWLALARKAGKVSKDPSWRPFDLGCRISDAWAGAEEVGLMPASAHPFDPSNVCDRPPAGAFQSGGAHKWLHYSYLPAVQSQIRSALQNGFGVGLPLPVDEWLTEWKASDGPWRLKGRVEGYHMVTLCGAVQDGMLFHTGWLGWNGGNQIGLCSWSMLNHDEAGLPIMLRASDKYLANWKG
jgi:hypothetical protein